MVISLVKREESIASEDVRTKLSDYGWYKIYLTSKWEHSPVERIVPQEGMFISGGIGTGKTSLMALMAMELVYQFNCVPRFISTGFLFDMYFEKRGAEIQSLMESSLLFLDDLGREYPADFPLMKFENFIEYRYGNLLPTFITSNMSIDDLRTRTGFERIADRVNDPKWMKHLTISGGSKRLRAK